MAKFFGAIGYAETVETSPGIWNEAITERDYYGDVLDNGWKLQSSDKVNDNINIANKISILSDPFANQNIYKMRYVVYMGVKWKIEKVDVQSPRLILTIGGLYNG